MALPANYNRILYKFKPHNINSEAEFLKIKSTDIITYQKKIKLKLKKERMVYLRHHRNTIVTFLSSTLIVMIMLLYMILSGDYQLFSSAKKGVAGYILLFIFSVSIITSAFYYFRGFPASMISFIKYLREKNKFFQYLKNKIDKCEDFFEYKGT